MTRSAANPWCCFQSLFPNPAWWICLLGLALSACRSDHLRALVPEELPLQPEARLQALADTSQTLLQLNIIRSDRRRLDSLIYFAEWLRDYDEEASFYYAGKAYDLATDRNWPWPRAISAYRLSVLKERYRRFGEDLEDAMVDIQISRRIFDQLGDEVWKARTYSFLGRLFFRNKQLDSARYYLGQALDKTAELALPESQTKKWKAIILHDLAITYDKDDPRYLNYLQESEVLYQELGLYKAMALVNLDIGKMYQGRGDFARTDSLYQLSYDYALEHSNIDVAVNALNFLGYSKTLQYYGSGNEKDFGEARHFFQKGLALESESDFLIYQNLGYLHQVHRYYSGENADIDSTIHYYKLAIQSAGKAGASDIVRTVSDLIADLCEDPAVKAYKSCDRLLGASAVAFVNQSFDTVFESRRKTTKTAYARTNRVEQREIIASAAQTRQDQLLISLAVLIIAGLTFLLLYQQQQKKRLQARMEALRAQINPHFVSNSLNAIENLINQDKKKDATKYIIHFSRLSRQILNRSRSADTSLKEELRTLRHFLELEKLRFRDKLNYEIVVDPGINEDLIQVPAMIFQPYVENAIWHGIKPKAAPSHLRVEIRRENKHLLGIIEDDGIGREASRAMKEKSARRQKSMGMEITEERIQGMGKVKGSQVEVIDLRNESGDAAGTRVQIRLPLKQIKG